MATCFSSEYQFPTPLLQPTLRFPMASMLFIALGDGVFLSGLSGMYWPSEPGVCVVEGEVLWGVASGAGVLWVEGCCPEALGVLDLGEAVPCLWAMPK